MAYNYNYNYSGEGFEELSGIGSVLGAMLFVFYLVAIVATVFFAVCNWKIFTKAGVPGWQSIIPYFSTYKQYEIAYGNGWLCFLLLIPFVNFFVSIHCVYKLATAFGKGIGFTLGLLFVPVVFYPILAFSKNIKYVGPYSQYLN